MTDVLGTVFLVLVAAFVLFTAYQVVMWIVERRQLAELEEERLEKQQWDDYCANEEAYEHYADQQAEEAYEQWKRDEDEAQEAYELADLTQQKNADDEERGW